MTDRDNDISRHIYRNGTRQGLITAAAMTTTVIATVMSTHLRGAAVVAAVAAVTVPLLIGVMMYRSRLCQGRPLSLVQLWTQGIVTASCGSLLMGAALYSYLRWCEPQWVNDTVSALATAADSADMPLRRYASTAARAMQPVIQHGSLSPQAAVTAEILWLSVIVNIVHTLVCASVIRCRDRVAGIRRTT